MSAKNGNKSFDRYSTYEHIGLVWWFSKMFFSGNESIHHENGDIFQNLGWDWCPHSWGFVSHHITSLQPYICWKWYIPFLVGAFVKHNGTFTIIYQALSSLLGFHHLSVARKTKPGGWIPGESSVGLGSLIFSWSNIKVKPRKPQREFYRHGTSCLHHISVRLWTSPRV